MKLTIGISYSALSGGLAILLASVPGLRAQCTPPPSGTMVAWYAFNETIGNLAENFATQNTGVWSSSPPTPVPGMVLGALSFNGTSNYVDSSTSLATNFGPGGQISVCSGGGGGAFSSCTGDFSFDAWVNIPSHPSLPKTIIDKRGAGPVGYSVYISQDRIGLQLADGTGTAGYDNYESPDLHNFTTNAWHHIAISVKRVSYIRFYFDGVQRGQVLPAHLGSLASVSILRIGANGPANPASFAFFQGMLDEVDLYNRALTTAEVQAIYAAGANGKCSQ